MCVDVVVGERKCTCVTEIIEPIFWTMRCCARASRSKVKKAVIVLHELRGTPQPELNNNIYNNKPKIRTMIRIVCSFCFSFFFILIYLIKLKKRRKGYVHFLGPLICVMYIAFSPSSSFSRDILFTIWCYYTNQI